MDFGVPKEVRSDEYRVGLTPTGVRILTNAGHRVYCEKDCGNTAVMMPASQTVNTTLAARKSFSQLRKSTDARMCSAK